jgi:alkylated DNA repair dioxygenase AlkB
MQIVPEEERDMRYKEYPRSLGEKCSLIYVPGFVLPRIAEYHFHALQAEIPWGTNTNVPPPKGLPRQVYWMGDHEFAYNGLKHGKASWDKWMAMLRDQVEDFVFGKPCGRYQGLFLNWYRDGRDSIPLHADNDPTIKPDSPIASISFGAERLFVLKHNAGKEPDVALKLESGSLLVMKGETQRYWRHEIPKQVGLHEGRINLTFREYLFA